MKNAHFKCALISLYFPSLAEGIEAEVLVVGSFEELKRRGSEAKGRIVVFNQPFVSYGVTVAYREYGASEASKFGAVATLIRSITPFSINRCPSACRHGYAIPAIKQNVFAILASTSLVLTQVGKTTRMV